MLALLTPPAGAARVKDVASIQGVRANQLVGYGLVVGLNASGDRNGTEFTVQTLTGLLSKIGVVVDANDVTVRNVAAVMVTASLPPFARSGAILDAVVSSVGDATSLEGGTLLLTPLYGTDGAVYALAQGAVSVGGFSAGGEAGSSVRKNHPTVGRVARGVTVERELEYRIEDKREFDVTLSQPDFTTIRRMAQRINDHFGAEVAHARNSGSLSLFVPEARTQDVVGFLAEVEALSFDPDALARVVLNERTGTVVIGAAVTLSQVAISHGSLSVLISAANEISQPPPFSAGETRDLRNETIEAVEEEARLTLVEGLTIGELVRGLNAIGVTPRDLIAILQAIQAAGALNAELELM